MCRAKCLLALLAWFVGVVHSCSPTIRFKIQVEPLNGVPTLSCDHSDDKMLQKKYTFREGEGLKIITEYYSFINYFICHDYNDKNVIFTYKEIVMKIETTFKVEKNMGTLWNCTILTHKKIGIIYPVVQYKNEQYTAVNCFMNIHVRRTEPPQTILVNNMVLPAVRTNLSEKLVDFTAEYQYADGDVVNVTCANFIKKEPLLTMEMEMAGIMSDNSIIKDQSSSEAISFVTKMHSGHNNSSMICTYTGTTDYTKVMVRFVMRTEFQIVSIKINGMNLRPNPYNAMNHAYRIKYKYRSYQPINVVCDVERTDVQLVVLDKLFTHGGEVSSYRRTELIPNKKTAISFSLQPTTADKPLACAADYHNSTSAEQVTIHFTEGYFPVDPYPLDLKFISNSTVMEIYSDYQVKIILYEFEEGETLNLTCGPLQRSTPGPLLYLELKDYVSKKCHKNGCTVSKTMPLTRKHENTDIVCYLKEKTDRRDPSTAEIVRKIRVILLKRVLTTATTTTAPSETLSEDTDTKPSALVLGGSIGTMLVVLAVLAAACCFKRARNAKRHIESQNGEMADLTNKCDIQYDVCYNDCPSNGETYYVTPVNIENIDPEEHQYTEIDYSRCKRNIGETQTRNSRVYDEPYVHINVRN